MFVVLQISKKLMKRLTLCKHYAYNFLRKQVPKLFNLGICATVLLLKLRLIFVQGVKFQVGKSHNE
jgi:hypothetical protein